MAGNKLALSTQVQYPRQIVNDVDAVIAPTTSSVAVTALTGPRTLMLPVVTAYPIGLPLIISDESGACSKTNTITLRNSENTSDITKITRPSQSVVLRNTGGAWILMDLTNEVLVRLLQTGPLAEALALKPSTINGKSPVNSALLLTGEDIALGASDTTNISVLITRLNTNVAGLASDTLDAIDQFNNAFLDKSKNLSELTDKSAARANLQLDSFYATRANATFTGLFTLRDSTSTGGISFNSGDTGHTGYINFIRSDGTRVAYIGYGDTNSLSVFSDTGIPWSFNVAPRVAGATIWHPGNFNPANYANLGQVNSFSQRQFMKLGSISLVNQDNIQSFREGGLYWTDSGTAAKGWPTDGYNHLICASYTDPNDYYSLQISGNFFNNSDFFIRKTTGGTSATNTWNKLVHSGNLRETVADGSYYVIRFPDGSMVQGGSSVVQLDANGKKTIPLITTGVTGCIPIVSNGDVNVNGNWCGSYSQNESGFGIYFPNSANATVRINWRAYSRWK